MSAAPPLHPQSVLAHPYVVTCTVAGRALQLYIGTENGRLWYDTPEIRAEGRYDVRELDICGERGMVGPGDVVFDVGAHNGVFSVWFASTVGAAGHVYAIDPVRENVAIIEKNAALNDMWNVTALHAAAGDHADEVIFNLDSCAVMAGAEQPMCGEEAARGEEAAPQPEPENGATCEFAPVRVAQITLDALDAPPPSLIKIDVEGYEGAVLRGAQRVLEATPNLAIEVHPAFSQARFGEDSGDALGMIDWSRYQAWALLPQWGYELRPWTPREQIVPDGERSSWIFAQRLG